MFFHTNLNKVDHIETSTHIIASFWEFVVYPICLRPFTIWIVKNAVVSDTHRSV